MKQVAILLVFLLCCQTGAAEKTPTQVLKSLLSHKLVSFDFKDTPALDAFDYLMTQSGANIVPDPQAFTGRQLKVTLEMTDAKLGDAVAQVARAVGLRSQVIRDVVVVSDEPGLKRLKTVLEASMLPDKPTKMERLVHKLLEERTVSLDLKDQPANEALEYVATVSNMNVVADVGAVPQPLPNVTLKLNNVSLDTAFRLVADRLGLKCSIQDYVIFISDNEGIAKSRQYWAEWNAVRQGFIPSRPQGPLAPEDRRVIRQLDRTTVTFEFDEKPLLDAVEYLAAAGKVNIVLDNRRLEPTHKVTMKLTKAPLKTAIAPMAHYFGLSCAIRGGVVFISDKDGTRKWLAEAGDVPLAKTDAKKAESRALRKQLLNTKVTFSIRHEPLQKVLAYLGAVGNVSVVEDIDRMADHDRTVSLKLTDASLATALRLAVEQAGLRYIVRDGMVVVSK